MGMNGEVWGFALAPIGTDSPICLSRLRARHRQKNPQPEKGWGLKSYSRSYSVVSYILVNYLRVTDWSFRIK